MTKIDYICVVNNGKTINAVSFKENNQILKEFVRSLALSTSESQDYENDTDAFLMITLINYIHSLQSRLRENK